MHVVILARGEDVDVTVWELGTTCKRCCQFLPNSQLLYHVIYHHLSPVFPVSSEYCAIHYSHKAYGKHKQL